MGGQRHGVHRRLTSVPGLLPVKSDGTYANAPRGLPSKRMIVAQIASPPEGPLRDEVDEWTARLSTARTPIGPVVAVDGLKELVDGLAQWPDHISRPEYANVRRLKDQLRNTGNPADAALRTKLLNLLEQAERQYIIKTSVLPDADIPLGDRKMLGVVDSRSQRLEAICLWEVVDTGTRKQGATTTDFSMSGWKKVLYISELVTAPWNTGWSDDPGVRGAGTRLLEAAADKARELGCEGIGLVALAANRDFYISAAGFRSLSGGDVLIKSVG